MPYASRYGRMYGGDFLGIGKALKKITKIQPFKIAGKIAGGVASSLPGIGTVYNIVKKVDTTLMPGNKKYYQPGTIMSGMEQAMGLSPNDPGWGSVKQTPPGSVIPGPPLPQNPDGSYGPIPKKGRGLMHRYRRMNPCNPRALRRGIRRLRGFEKFARQVMVVHNFKHAGRLRVGHGYRRKKSA